MEGREGEGVRWRGAELPGARGAFPTRLGGVSGPPYDETKVGILTGDQPETVRVNRGRLAFAVGRAPESVVMGRQVHGNELRRHEVTQEPPVYAEVEKSPDEVDAQVTSNPGLTPLVMVA